MIFMDSQGRISKEPPMVSFLDHGFLFGDSIYEVVRVYQRKVFSWLGHRARLLESARRLQLPLEPLLQTIEERMKELLAELGEPDAALRMVITRGVGKLHINPRSCGEPQIFMAAWKYEPHLHSKPVSLIIPKVRRNPREALDPAIKSGNYLNSVMAYQEAQAAGVDDAVFLNPSGHVTEMTTSNIGWFRGSTICTPADEAGILLGITRKVLLESHPVETGLYGVDCLEQATEVFALSTFKEVVPVALIQFENGKRREFKDFSQTVKLQKTFHSVVEKVLSNEPQWY
jgi:branched-chain amino acid aminotransferase